MSDQFPAADQNYVVRPPPHTYTTTISVPHPRTSHTDTAACVSPAAYREAWAILLQSDPVWTFYVTCMFNAVVAMRLMLTCAIRDRTRTLDVP